MANQPDAELLHSQVAVYKLQKKTTEELLAIWTKNDQTQWTHQDFDMIKKILTERLGQVPEQQSVALQNDRPNSKKAEAADKTFFIIIAIIAAICICVAIANQLISI